MILENGTMRLPGSKIKQWFGTFLLDWGNKIINKNKDVVISNPTCILANPFTLIVSFTVNTSNKFQVTLEGDYKELYKEAEDRIPKTTEDQLFHIIHHNQKNWFKKE